MTLCTHPATLRSTAELWVRRVLPEGSLRARFARGAIWSLVGTVGGRLFTLLSGILVARLLGKESYGELAIILSTALMFQTFGAFGLGLTATKHVAELRATNPEKASRIMVLSQAVAVATGALCAVAMYLLSPWLAREILAAPHLVDLLRISGVILFFGSLSGAQGGALAGLEAFQSVAAITLSSGLVTVPLTVGAVLWFGLEGAVWAAIAVSALTCILNHVALRRHVIRHGLSMRMSGWWREGRVLWRFSIPALLAGIMVAPVTWACAAMLVNEPGGYASMGEFNAVMTFQNAIVLICTTVAQPLLPMLASYAGKETPALAKFNILLTWLLGLAPCLVLISFPEIAEWLLGSGFAGESFRTTLVVSMLVTTVILFKAGLARVLMARGLMWWGFLSNLVWAAILIGSAVFFVHWGAVGLAGAYLLAYAGNTILVLPFYISRRLLPLATAVSWKTLAIWGSLSALTGLVFFGATLEWRLFLFVATSSVFAVTFLAFRIFR
ncbi:putative membrane protein [Candidatus Defluviicoccus seviourii]|uniref:Membrane protein n=1 Tax=Candidatus Defluviicoccus seviourii TaxID=2565273 RepID=A0A564WFJ5_9PROT|nr:putative membrane protein [Candidatus Defluviicoccus seviourii]